MAGLPVVLHLTSRFRSCCEAAPSVVVARAAVLTKWSQSLHRSAIAVGTSAPMSARISPSSRSSNRSTASSRSSRAHVWSPRPRPRAPACVTRTEPIRATSSAPPSKKSLVRSHNRCRPAVSRIRPRWRRKSVYRSRNRVHQYVGVPAAVEVPSPTSTQLPSAA